MSSMASFFNFIFIFFLSLIGSILSSAHSLTCSSQSFPNRSFSHCNDLPHLNAFLHWSHDSKNSSLSVAFLAPPPNSGGWVAWAVNPTSTGMAGSQAFLASLSTAGTPSVRTFNISSYSSVLPSPLSFPVWNLAADFSHARFTIYATLKLPPNAKSLNQIWQVGSDIDPESGNPAVHDFKPDNLNVRSVLVFDAVSPAPRAHGGASPAPAPAPLGSRETASPARRAPGSEKSGVARIRTGNLRVVVGLFAFIWGLFVSNF